MENTLYYGDNLEILREYIEDNSIDLIYLDPPFSSNKDYNILFGEKNGTQSPAQIKAFEDTWHWDRKAEETYREIEENLPKKIADLIRALRSFFILRKYKWKNRDLINLQISSSNLKIFVIQQLKTKKLLR